MVVTRKKRWTRPGERHYSPARRCHVGEETIEELAKILHESGREAVERGLVFMKGPDIKPRPFAEWGELPEDAKAGRRLMARHLVGVASAVIYLLEGTLPPPTNVVG